MRDFATGKRRSSLLLLLALLLSLASCERPDPETAVFVTPGQTTIIPPTPVLTPFSGTEQLPPTPQQSPADVVAKPTYLGTPTPDPPHGTAVTTDGSTSTTHTVSVGETLGYIAQLYGTSVDALLELNQLANGNLLYAGQALLVPTSASQTGPAFKIIPDSELVYGPAAKGFDVRQFAEIYGGYLLDYEEVVEERPLAGPEIVSLVAHRFSVNPRLLLAALEYRAGWITKPTGIVEQFPLGYRASNQPGLYAQLGWMANELNWGFYGRAEGGLNAMTLTDGTRIGFDPTINHGTAGVQKWLGAHDDANYATWLQETGPDGFWATYNTLFGNPFAYTVDPLWPANLSQPSLQLPWSSDETWYYTGGPHGGWAAGSAWAALDFAPPADQLGCVQSESWVTAAADGIVTRSDFGAVVVDLDLPEQPADGYAGTGWAITYMHLETRDRIAVGTPVQVGDRLGHPSCEGGFSNGTHLHLARTYNGRWVAADGELAFNMAGWISQGLGSEYDGLLVRGTVSREACVCRDEINAITP
ncbi:MAG: LysM peptidoglycan-binding domain-containing protein [Ardenticatenaceae bacterium]|nr:LysM peptidoglycan-binding domain-containing protein [Ardenticatenaceae bacterium]